MDVSNLQPDTVVVHQALKKIGIIDHCRPYDGADGGNGGLKVGKEQARWDNPRGSYTQTAAVYRQHQIGSKSSIV